MMESVFIVQQSKRFRHKTEKSEARISKLETNSNDKKNNDKNKR